MNPKLLRVGIASRILLFGLACSPNCFSQALPEPFARWTFDTDARDVKGSMHGHLVGGAVIQNGLLVLNGTDAYLQTDPLPKNITEKTLVAKVALANLDQGGGGVITLETLDGGTFDAIVFGEREHAKWMVGSDFWNRTVDVEAPEETAAPSSFVQMAAVYRADGSISLYRNGQPYGSAWTPGSPLQTYPSANSRVLLGLRHDSPGGNKFLIGEIDEAALYDRALTAEEVASLSSSPTDFSIRNSRVSGFGGASSGGDFALRGDAPASVATSSGGAFTLNAGFWNTISLIQTPGMPRLEILVAGGSPVLSWPFANGTSLEESPDLDAARWTLSPETPATVDGKTTVRVSRPVSRKFYRLRQTNP